MSSTCKMEINLIKFNKKLKKMEGYLTLPNSNKFCSNSGLLLLLILIIKTSKTSRGKMKMGRHLRDKLGTNLELVYIGNNIIGSTVGLMLCSVHLEVLDF